MIKNEKNAEKQRRFEGIAKFDSLLPNISRLVYTECGLTGGRTCGKCIDEDGKKGKIRTIGMQLLERKETEAIYRCD
jgi:hypothetical protein